MKLDYIVLPAEDVNETKTWYMEHLGLAVEWENDDFVLMTGDNGARLGIHRGSPLSEPHEVNIHFEVEDINQTYNNLREGGLEFSSPPEDTEWGYRTAVCQDPAGHTVELFTPSRA